MKFYAIRHAQSENNLLYVQTGSHEGRDEDPGLTPLGQQQAARLAAFLRAPGEPGQEAKVGYDPLDRAGFRLTHLYCSLMVRAVATGAVVTQALGLPLVAWPDLHETGGIYRKDPQTGERLGLPGKDRRYFERTYPGLVLPDWLGNEGWWNRPYEAREERRGRARRFLDELLARHGDREDRVAVITHGGFYNQLMATILGLPQETPTWFTLVNAAISRIDFQGGVTVVQYLNRADYLPAEMIT